MITDNIEKLIEEFSFLPKAKFEPTYLEICKYPKRRFEEICSRILCFYLAPKNEHGFNDLFLKSLLEILSKEPISFYEEQVKVISEENAEGKRLDILVYSNNFVIGIENKITASVYNPLETYKNRIDLYKKENVFRLVLSLRKITQKEELIKLKESGFTQLTYLDFFNIIRKNIGQYIQQANPKYLIFLTDFIQTLETMSGENILNDKLADYFFDNKDKIDGLIELYQKYNSKTTEIQISRIAELKEALVELTKNSDWWIYEGWDLGYTNLSTNKPRIGIECSYESTRGKALGKFRIYLTAWKLKDWAFYEEQILTQYPKNFLDKSDNRAYLHMEVIADDNEELILNKLVEYFTFIQQLTNE